MAFKQAHHGAAGRASIPCDRVTAVWLKHHLDSIDPIGYIDCNAGITGSPLPHFNPEINIVK